MPASVIVVRMWCRPWNGYVVRSVILRLFVWIMAANLSLVTWIYGLTTRGVVLDFSRPGKPTDNSYIESFNGKFRAECLNAHWFMSLDDVHNGNLGEIQRQSG